MLLQATFDTGLTSMASYLGNVILPVVAGLCLCVGVYQLAHKSKGGEHYVTCALACLMAAGFVRLAEHFAGTSYQDPDQYYNALISLTNWLANVVLPIYAAVNLLRGILSMSNGGMFELTSVGGNVGRHFMVAIACISLSGGLRLLEWFVSQGAGGIK